MPLTFSFALSQQQTFELRCDYGSRRLDKVELVALIDLCEQNYYAQQRDRLPLLIQIGRQLYQWLDGKEGWLRRALDEAEEQTIYLDLIQTSEARGLNLETERVALGLAHLPWELLHDGSGLFTRTAGYCSIACACSAATKYQCDRRAKSSVAIAVYGKFSRRSKSSAASV
jgi:hypothetical protein